MKERDEKVVKCWLCGKFMGVMWRDFAVPSCSPTLTTVCKPSQKSHSIGIQDVGSQCNDRENLEDLRPIVHVQWNQLVFILEVSLAKDTFDNSLASRFDQHKSNKRDSTGDVTKMNCYIVLTNEEALSSLFLSCLLLCLIPNHLKFHIESSQRITHWGCEFFLQNRY